MTWPSIAVIMTVYNASSTIRLSIQSALQQVYPGEFSLIVVDDGSTDDTAAAVRAISDPRLRFVEAGRLLRPAALNRALLEAAGYDLIANLDADDYMLPGRLTSQARAFRASEDLVLYGSAYYEIHPAESRPDPEVFLVSPPQDDRELRRAMSTHFPVCHSAAMYRRAAALNAGGFDESRKSRIDFDLWLRIAAQGGRIGNSSEVLAIHAKRTGTYFDRQFSRSRSAIEMARLNFGAVRRLKLGLGGYVLALARLTYSLARTQSVKRHPRYGMRLDSVPDEVRQAAGLLSR